MTKYDRQVGRVKLLCGQWLWKKNCKRVAHVFVQETPWKYGQVHYNITEIMLKTVVINIQVNQLRIEQAMFVKHKCPCNGDFFQNCDLDIWPLSWLMTLNLVSTGRSCHKVYSWNNCYQSKDMANIKVFADKETDRQMGQKLYAPDLSMQGHKNSCEIHGYTITMNYPK